MIEFNLPSSVQLKRKPRKLCQNQSKLSLIYLPIVWNVIMQKPSIVLTNMITKPDTKINKNILELSLIGISNKHKDQVINISNTGVLVEQKPIQVTDILKKNSSLEILSKDIGKMN